MTPFSQILTKDSTHSVEQVMLISEHPCGCMTTITFAGYPGASDQSDKDGLRKVPSNIFWFDSSKCDQHQGIDFSELAEIAKYVPLRYIAGEMRVSGSISVSKMIAIKEKNTFIQKEK